MSNPIRQSDPAPGIDMSTAAPFAPFVAVEDRWIQCDACNKWRRVTDEKADISAEKWYCHMNTWDPSHATCEAEEENSDDDEVAQAALKLQEREARLANKRPKPYASRRKKKRSSDSDEDATSATNSADEAFFMAIDEAAVTGRRSGRATRAPVQQDDSDSSDDGRGNKRKPKTNRTTFKWSEATDDALLSAIHKHGVGNWTNMMNDPEFGPRFEGLKPGGLRIRWKKLGSAEFVGDHFSAGGQQLAAKREQVFEQMAQDQSVIQTPEQHQQQMQQQQMQQQQQSASNAQKVTFPAVVGPPPNTTPFVAYRPYPSHVFDLPNASKTKVASDAVVKDGADPMDLSNSAAKKKRGRKHDSDESDYGDDESDEDETGGATKGVDEEFKDLDNNLDNAAYMYYYDHRNSAMVFYETFSVPMRELKKQFLNQYQMKLQDSLELMKALGEAHDLYSRRNILAKAIHAHFTHFQQAQYIRQWTHSVRSMTTQHVHATHDLKLKQDQQVKVAEAQARKAYQEKHGVPMPEDIFDDGGVQSSTTPHGINPKTGQPWLRGPYNKTNQPPEKRAPPPAVVTRLPVNGSSPGLVALEKLPYYWRTKLHVAKKLNQPFPEVTGATPSRAMLQLQLDEVKVEWNSPHMTQAILAMRVGEKQVERLAQASNITPQPTPQVYQPIMQQQPTQPMSHPTPALAVATPTMAGLPFGLNQQQFAQMPQAMQFQQQPQLAAQPTHLKSEEGASEPVPNIHLRKVDNGYSVVAPRTSGRKRRASTAVKKEYVESTSESEGGHDDDDYDAYEEEEPEEDLSGIYLDHLYPLPNIRLKRLAPGSYQITKIVEQPTIYEDEEEGQDTTMKQEQSFTTTNQPPTTISIPQPSDQMTDV